MPEGLPIRPQDNSAADEATVRPLVHAALTAGWKPAINLLYFHGTLLELSEEVGIPILVSVRGNTEGLDQVSELFKARTSSEAMRILRSWIKEIVPLVLQSVQEAGPDAVSVSGIAATLGAQAAKSGGPHARIIQDMLRKGFEDAVTFSGGLSAIIFEFLLAKRTAYLTNVMPEAEYERMVQQLSKLGIVEPRLEVSICAHCHNHYVVVSGFPSTPKTCTKCGFPWVTVELFVFRESFSRIELGSSLMALFISAYLREKVNAQSPMLDLEVYPNAIFQANGKTAAEVDVYVPRSATGYECKAFEDVFAPLTTNRIGSVTGRVLGQINLYLSLGIRNIVIATNLPANGAQRIQRELLKKLGVDQTKPASLVVLPGNPESLIKHLDEVSAVLAKNLNEDFGKSYEGGSQTKGKPNGPPQPPGKPSTALSAKRAPARRAPGRSSRDPSEQA